MDEERTFVSTLDRGRNLVRRMRSRGLLTDSDFQFLYETHGLPRDPSASCSRRSAEAQG
jgi:alanyl-tRNA synthetase